MLTRSGEETELSRIGCDGACRQSCLQADSHCVPSGDCYGAMSKRVPALASSDIVMRMARTTMEGARGQTDAVREFVQLLNTIRHEVKPHITVLQDLGIINIYHLQFSLPSWNLPLGDIFVINVFV